MPKYINPFTFLLVLVLQILVPPSLGFSPESHYCRGRGQRTSSPFSNRVILYGLIEWRQNVKNRNKSEGAYQHFYDQTFLPLLPFAQNQALVQGQSRSVVLTEGRHFDLLQDAVEDHDSIIGMALVGDDDADIQTEMPLCEIVDYEVRAGFRGRLKIDLNLRTVGRATLLELTQIRPVMKGLCRELEDTIDVGGLADANSLVEDIEGIIKNGIGQPNAHGLHQRYDQAYALALDTITPPHRLQQDEIECNICARSHMGSQSQFTHRPVRERSTSELEAASWAVFAAASDKSSLSRAIACADLTGRLRLGRRVMLEEWWRRSTVGPSSLPNSPDSSKMSDFL